jgi:hypothetical protein
MRRAEVAMLYAKRAKRDELRIVCGACGNGLAWIVGGIVPPANSSKVDVDPAAPARRFDEHVMIPEGWFPDTEGVWRPSQRARRLLRRGLPPQNRRRPKPEVRRLKEHGTNEDARDEWRRHRFGFVLTVLPVEIMCLYCDMRQALDAEALKVDGIRMPPDELALMAANGPKVRLGLYPGSLPFEYRRVQDAKTKRWTAEFVGSWLSYRFYLETRGAR